MKKKNLLQRTIIIVLITLAGIYVVIGPRRRPTLHDFSWSGIKATLATNIHLGLDLKGGSHLVMRVKTDDVLKNLTLADAVAIDKGVKDAGLPVKEVRPESTGGNYRIILETTDPSKIAEIEENAKTKLGADLSVWTSSVSGNTIVWTLPASAQANLAEQATQQAQRIIESRLDAVGVAEPLVQRHGSQASHQILVQMPGIHDPERVKEILKADSKLELVHVIGPSSPAPIQTYNTEDEAKASVGPTMPANRRVVPYAERDEPTAGGQATTDAQKVKKWVVIESPAVVDGSELRNAAAVQAQGGGDTYSISFSLKPVGSQKFGAWTAAHINDYMGVVLNNEVKSIAYIKSAISDSGEISGRFTKQSADDLVLTLRSGALPASIEYMEERTVGASLGDDSIRSGVRASVVGLIMVVLFMLVYYRGSGVNAVVALILNMILMIAGLILFQATLTLPGIAGIILTIGMAVDSNVLIFERIREELRTGKTIPSAIEQGFARAFVTIIDTHVTTTVSSLFLFLFGTGPLKGFAVTLVMGLAINLFSAVYVSRTIFMWELSRKKKMESLSI
ncbi:MAG TPA: protein translocase subunit SecD [Pyrinomonadaceae bacterium]|nr:protein translocase subunit SecD [Pyrinomonadaceae bacterium]